jgi:ABC-type sugar transport system permease subunit
MRWSPAGAGARAAVLLLPAALFFVLAFLVPLVSVVQLSFFQTDYVTTKYVGLQNYLRSFTDPDFLKTFFTAGVYMVMVVPVSIFAGYQLSVRLVRLGNRQRTLFQTIYYLPTLVSGIVISLVWSWVFGRGGVIALGMTALGIEPIAWFAGGWTARMVISFSVAFSSIGGNCIWLCAVLLSIPRDLYDAAKVDGASNGQMSRYITRPLMGYTLTLLAMLQAIGALQYWEAVYAMTSGGPYKMTATPIYDIYMTAFVYGKHGMAAAKSVLLVFVVATLIGIKKLVERKGQ